MRRLGAALLLLVSVAVPPWALAVTGFVDVGAITLWSASDPRVLRLLLTVLGWVLWAVWLVSVLTEVAGQSAGRVRRIRVPGLELPRALAATLVGLAFAAAASTSADATETTSGRGAEATVAKPSVTSVTETAPAARGIASPGRSHPGATHVVVAGDDLWSLAERYYGEGTQWRRIVAANPDFLTDATTRPPVGERLVLPPRLVPVHVQAGDTLSSLAERHLGEASRWPEIREHNRSLVKDPDLIKVGWVLQVPQALLTDEPAPRPPSAAPTPSTPDQVHGAAPSGVTASPAPDAVPAPPEVERVAPDPEVEHVAPDPEAGPVAGIVGGLSSLTASAIVGGLALRRRLQEADRPLGRRFAAPSGELSRVEAAVRLAASGQEGPPRSELLDRALRLLAAHWSISDEQALPLERLLLDAHGLQFRFVTPPPSAPVGFALLDGRLHVSWSALADLERPDTPAAYPALVTLGQDVRGRQVLVDLAERGVQAVRGDDGAVAGLVRSVVVELGSAPWAAETDVLVVGPESEPVRGASMGRFAWTDATEDGVATVERLVAQRRCAVPSEGWATARLVPELTEAWSPQLVVFERPPEAAERERLRAALAGPSVGVSALVPWPTAVTDPDDASAWRLEGTDQPRLIAGDETFVPAIIPTAMRDGLSGLWDLATRTNHESAPWWRTSSTEDAVNIIALHPRVQPDTTTGPRLGLLGPISLDGCAGEPPVRAVRQCVEYCAWLHFNPGATAPEMARTLLVAEGTRRSNMSRLRTWLGRGPSGELYLPDAYSGRIELDPEVTSDWDDLQLLVQGGINHQPLDRLVAALRLVRGAPLADAAPGQWGWAEEFRSDASALIRDLAVVVARRSREKGDLETARWAALRGLMAAPDDELLAAERIRIELRAGRPDEAQRLVHRLVRAARNLGVDLLPETVGLCQEVVEGRRRAQG